jgi:hypothetical protein
MFFLWGRGWRFGFLMFPMGSHQVPNALSSCSKCIFKSFFKFPIVFQSWTLITLYRCAKWKHFWECKPMLSGYHIEDKNFHASSQCSQWKLAIPTLGENHNCRQFIRTWTWYIGRLQKAPMVLVLMLIVVIEKLINN